MSWRALLVVAALLAGACPGVATPLERPRVSVSAVSLVQGPASLVMRVRVAASNPNATLLTARAVDWELALGGAAPWRGRAHLDVALAARAAAVFDLELAVPAGVAGDMAARLASGGRDYHLTATVHWASSRGELAAHVEATGALAP